MENITLQDFIKPIEIEKIIIPRYKKQKYINMGFLVKKGPFEYFDYEGDWIDHYELVKYMTNDEYYKKNLASTKE